MKSLKPAESLVKTLIRNAQEAREMAQQFTQRIEQRSFATVYRRIQKSVTSAAESGKFEVRVSLAALRVKEASVPGMLARLNELGFKAEATSYEAIAPGRGKQTVKGLTISFAPETTSK